MKQFLQTYRWRILYCFILLALVFLIPGPDYNHYLYSNYKSFTVSVTKTLLILVIVLVAILVALAIWRGTAFSKMYVVAFGVTWLIFIQLCFGTIVSNTCLLINRQYHGETVNKQFIMYTVPGMRPSVTAYKSSEIFLNELVDSYPLPASTKNVDTITIPFTKGFFGVPYLDKK